MLRRYLANDPAVGVVQPSASENVSTSRVALLSTPQKLQKAVRTAGCNLSLKIYRTS